MIENKTNLDRKYIKILILLFLVNFLIAISGTIYINYVGNEHVFHSWMRALYTFSWILTIGLGFIVPMTYCNKSIGVLIWPLILIALFFVIVFGYKKEIKSGPYIKQEVQGLGEKTIYYYKDVNIFIMEKSHSEIIR